MLLSISNFSEQIPVIQWKRTALLTGIVFFVLFLIWEMLWRGAGYVPSHNDTKDLWAQERQKLQGASENTIVLIGASRIRFDLDLDVLENAFDGIRPIQLAINGGVARLVLKDLANDESFHGTVISGVVPSLFFIPAGQPYEKTMEWIEYAKQWRYTDKVSHRIKKTIETSFAFYKPDELSLSNLLRMVQLPNREGLYQFPRMPPMLSLVMEDRREFMLKTLANNIEFQHLVRGIWKELFTLGPPYDDETIMMVLEDVRNDVMRIRERGGNVIFIRLPSSGDIRQIENERTPREKFWDSLLEYTKSPGIHFEDYRALSKFKCPEWSHLNSVDAIKFTKRLTSILQNQRKQLFFTRHSEVQKTESL